MEYRRARKYFKDHKGIKKRIERLTLELESPDVRQELSFEMLSQNMPPPIKQQQQLKKKKLLRGKKRKVLEEIVPNDGDGDVAMIESRNGENSEALQLVEDCAMSSECSYPIDKERLLKVLNTNSIEMLKTLKTVGPAKAKAIVDGRPFDKLGQIQKVHGFHTVKAWSNLLEKNKITFEYSV